MNGERPSRPAHPSLNDPLWELIQRCWSDAAKDRPEMTEVVKDLIIMSVHSVFEVNGLLTLLQNIRKNTPPFPTPSEKPPATAMGPSRKPSARSALHKKGVREDAQLTPYDVGPSQPVQTPPKEGKRPSASRETVAIGEGITSGPSSRPPQTSTGVVVADAPIIGSRIKVENKRENHEQLEKGNEGVQRKVGLVVSCDRFFFQRNDFLTQLQHKESRKGLEHEQRGTQARETEINPVPRPTAQESSLHRGDGESISPMPGPSSRPRTGNPPQTPSRTVDPNGANGSSTFPPYLSRHRNPNLVKSQLLVRQLKRWTTSPRAIP